ncbi:MAG: RtcB family protein, partial [Planctomycetes bacterium]|nr:RtcB family protein [Planctomycetota bacterium]
MSKKPIRVDDFRLKLPRDGAMHLDAWIYASEKLKLESKAIEQLRNGASMPGVRGTFGMPDIHVGYGVPIGSVVGLDGNICPAAVGYDINCGLRLLKTTLNASEIDAGKLADSIARDLPLGEGKKNLTFSDADFTKVLQLGVPALLDKPGALHTHRAFKGFRTEDIERDIEHIENNGSMDGKVETVSQHAFGRGKNQLGTLGGGNHFVELQVVERILDNSTAQRFGLFKGQFVVMIHTGSRGFGHQVCDEYLRAAKKLTGDKVVDQHLAYLPVAGEQGQNYIGAMHAAANFTFTNREIISLIVRSNLRYYYPELEIDLLYDVTHNMAKLEKHGGEEIWVHRKGTTRAFTKERMQGTAFADVGQPVLIPGSMGTGSYVLLGVLGNEKTFASVNHGAGRVMSRTAAAGKYRK